MLRHLLLCLTASLDPAVAHAQTPPATQATPMAPAPAFEARAKELATVLTDAAGYEVFFSPGFRAAVPREKFEPLRAGLREAHGPISGVRIKAMATPWTGTLEVDYRDAVATMTMAVDATEPHQVSGLRVTGVSGHE